MSKPAILCVDDEPVVLESLKIELRQTLGDSCLIETAESGEEALELIEELQSAAYEIALVFADQRMPGMHGDQLLEQIHLRSPQTLNILLTGHADLKTLSQVMRTAKLYRYITKPWQSEDLRSTVLDAIQSYRHSRQLEIENVKLQRTVNQLEAAINSLKQSEQQLQQQSQQQASMSRLFLAFAAQQFEGWQVVQDHVLELEHLNQLKDNFLNSISHELRSPVSNIRMATQMLQVRLQQLGVDDAAQQCERYFQILRTECQKEVDLINDLLALMRLNSDSDPLNLSTINLNLWLPHIVEPFAERLREREQHLQIQIPESLPALTTDLLHLERALTELLTNACKYTPVGETISIKVEVVSQGAGSLTGDAVTERSRSNSAALPSIAMLRTPDADTSELWLSVTNSGVEISSEACRGIFEQFYRISNSGMAGGNGLGLAIVKKRIEKLRGSISVISQNQQTTFTIKLPL